MSTANLFGLPPFYQYGVGSAGFGAWREMVANRWATGWVLDGRTGAFPLMYHWRVLPGAPPPPDETRDVERAVAYWEGSAAGGTMRSPRRRRAWCCSWSTCPTTCTTG